MAQIKFYLVNNSQNPAVDFDTVNVQDQQSSNQNPYNIGPVASTATVTTFATGLAPDGGGALQASITWQAISNGVVVSDTGAAGILANQTISLIDGTVVVAKAGAKA